MQNDLVTRLREYCDCTDRGKCFGCEAADEIESLRKEVNRLHREMDMELFGESDIKEDE